MMSNGRARCLRCIWPSNCLQNSCSAFYNSRECLPIDLWVSGCLILPICREHTRQEGHQRVKSVAATKEEKPWTKGEAGANWMRTVSLNAWVACCIGNSHKCSLCFRGSLWLAPSTMEMRPDESRQAGNDTARTLNAFGRRGRCWSTEKRLVLANISKKTRLEVKGRGGKTMQKCISKLLIHHCQQYIYT